MSPYYFHIPFKPHAESSSSGLISLIFCFCIDFRKLYSGVLEDLNLKICCMKFKGPSTVLRGLKFLPEKLRCLKLQSRILRGLKILDTSGKECSERVCPNKNVHSLKGGRILGEKYRPTNSPDRGSAKTPTTLELMGSSAAFITTLEIFLLAS